MSEQAKELQAPSNRITVKICSNDYHIDFPTNGKLISIERYKNSLTGGTSQQMLQNGSSGLQAYVLSEAIATFSILIPSLDKDMQVNSLLDLNPFQSKTLEKAYEQYFTWMEDWRAFLNQDFDKIKEAKGE